MDQLGSDMLVDSDSAYDEKQEDVAIISPEDSNSMDDVELLPRADDFEAMFARFLPENPDLETESQVVNTWDVEGWRSLPRRTHGPTFKCAGHPWRILCFPYGNNSSESISMYLEQGFDEKPPEDWYACVQFMLVLWNPNDPTMYIRHDASHRFTGDEGDWGFTRFAEKHRIFAANFEDKGRPMVENDCAKVTAYVRVLKDPTGVLWHNFVNYDSRKETGMVGLKNQGATCYLNSLLQSLYFTNAFRKAVYQIPTEGESEPRKNSAYALQRLFYRLQTDPYAVSTQELTISFGWENRQVFEQQDVQELSRVLMDKMEMRMKGTEAENALPNMFRAKMKTYLRCINVDFKSERLEDYWDLQLNVSGCKTLDDSFRSYIEVETLEGDNKYAAEGYGLQDAKKGVVFESFPEVLHLQLKRFEYDFNRDAMMKVNDRYEFPEIWDASPYLSETADHSEPYIYHLHGVLVHSGDLNTGHYYAFLKPHKNGDFFRFDDDRVTRATRREALEENFGGDYLMNGTNGIAGQRNPYTRTWSTKRAMSAYMLVYIRESRLDDVLLDEKHMEPPPHLPQRIAEERAILEKKRRDRDEAHLYMEVTVASIANFQHYQGFDLANWDNGDPEDPATPTKHKLLRTTTMAELSKFIAGDLGVDADLVRPWVMVNRQNGTVRPDAPIMWPTMTIEEASHKLATKHAKFRVFMEQTERDANGEPIWHWIPTAGPAPANKPIILFLKHFDVEKQTLLGAGHIYMNQQEKAQELASPVLQVAGWPPGTNLVLYEEIKHNMIEKVKPKVSLIASEIQDGDIICYQKSLSDKEENALKAAGRCSDAAAFYDYLLNRMVVHFHSKVPVAEEPAARFDLVLSKKDSYDTFAAKVADHLTTLSGNPDVVVDPTHIKFTTMNATTGKPKAVVKRGDKTTLSSVLLSSQGYGAYGGAYGPGHVQDALFYEVLEMSLSELELRKVMKVTWLSEGITKEDTYDILVPKQGTIEDLSISLQRKANLSDDTMANIRVYEVHLGKVYKILSPTYSVASCNEFYTVYAERIPEEELQAEEGDRLVGCMHYEKEINKPHGVPFNFLVKS
ncbi:hypothetical protein LTR04_001636, partial [Oleoguttula sp. CCFEE 6159]